MFEVTMTKRARKSMAKMPALQVSFLRLNYGEVEITNPGDFAESDSDDATMRVEDMDWYKEAEAKMTPGYNLRIFCQMRKITQQELADTLGISKQQISNMETGRLPIGKKMAMLLGKALDRPYKNFFW
jgi:DNA-binding XRE family transcriptional regulator